MTGRAIAAGGILSLLLVSGFGAAVAFMGGVSSSNTVTIPSGTGAGPNAGPGYSPATITVVIGVNNTVTWGNDDTVAHTVTATNQTGGKPAFDSGSIAPAATFSFTFTTAGTYLYHCNFHSWMAGTVIVKPSTNPVSTVIVTMPSGAGSPAGAPGYSPDKITVVMGINNTIEWTNNDTAHHTVTSVSGNGSLSSGDMAPGAAYTYTFASPGTYNYDCTYHSWMVGTVVVKASTSPVPEFPVASLALVLFAVVAIAVVAAGRIRRTPLGTVGGGEANLKA